jgi:hypothetical protein
MAENKLYTTIKCVNDINVLREMRKDFNDICEAQEKHLQAIEESKTLNTNSFLFIKESFDNLSKNLFKTKEGRKVINRYINEHKNNKDLQKMFFVYENITRANKNLNVDNLLSEMKKLVGNINETKLNKGLERISNLLKEAYVIVGTESGNLISKHNNRVLDESVNYVVANSKKLDNLTQYSMCVNEIKKFINNNEVIETVFENTILKPEDVIKEFNEKYSEETLGKENYELFLEIKDAEDKGQVFEKYKNECLKTLDEAINSNQDQVTCNQLYEFKTRITRKEYNPETIGTDVANFIELQKTVKE